MQAGTVNYVIGLCKNEVERSVEPLELLIKFVWLFEILAGNDRIFRIQYTRACDAFNQQAKTLFDAVPSIKLASWVMEVRVYLRFCVSLCSCICMYMWGGGVCIYVFLSIRHTQAHTQIYIDARVHAHK